MADSEFDLLRAFITVEGRQSRRTLSDLERGTNRLGRNLDGVQRRLRLVDRGLGRWRVGPAKAAATAVDKIGDEARESAQQVADLQRRLQALQPRAAALDAQGRARDARGRFLPGGGRAGGGASRTTGGGFVAGAGQVRRLIGAAVAFEGTRRAIRFGGEAADLADNFEQAQTQFKVLLGDIGKANELLGQLRTFTASTPFQESEVVPSARLLAAFGVEQQKIIPTLQTIGNISAGTGNRLNELAEIYGKVRVQGRLFAEDVNQFTGRGIPIIAALAKEFKTTEVAVKQLVTDGKVGFAELEKAFNSLAGAGGQFEGLTNKLAETAAGQISTLNDQLAAIKRDIGESLSPIRVGTLTLQVQTARVIADQVRTEEQRDRAIQNRANQSIEFNRTGVAGQSAEEARINREISAVRAEIIQNDIERDNRQAFVDNIAEGFRNSPLSRIFGPLRDTVTRTPTFRSSNLGSDGGLLADRLATLLAERDAERARTRPVGEGAAARAVTDALADIPGRIATATAAGSNALEAAAKQSTAASRKVEQGIASQIQSNDRTAAAIGTLGNAIGQGIGFVIEVVD